MDDFDPHQINWEELFEMEGTERVIDSYVEDLSKPVRWQSCAANLTPDGDAKTYKDFLRL